MTAQQGPFTVKNLDLGEINRVLRLMQMGASSGVTAATPTSIQTGVIAGSATTGSSSSSVPPATFLTLNGESALPQSRKLAVQPNLTLVDGGPLSSLTLGTTAFTGDVATSANSFATTISAHAVTNAKLAQMPPLTIKGNNTGGLADPLDLTATQVTAMLDLATASLPGTIVLARDLDASVFPTVFPLTDATSPIVTGLLGGVLPVPAGGVQILGGAKTIVGPGQEQIMWSLHGFYETASVTNPAEGIVASISNLAPSVASNFGLTIALSDDLAAIEALTTTGIVKRTGTNTWTAAALVSGDIPNNAADTTGKSAKTDALNSATTVVNVAAATAPTTGQVLTATDSTHATWQTPTVGTVTSVGLSLPAEFTITVSPITSSGTLTATWATETANKVFAGPTTGSPATPAFRSLVAADIPNLDASKITTGTLALARGGTNADLSATGGASKVLMQTSLGAAITVAQLANTDITGLGTMSTQNANAVAITGGNIDGTTIGGTTKAAGSFTSVVAAGGTATVTLGSTSQTITGTFAGSLDWRVTNSDTGTAAQAQFVGTNDAGVNAVLVSQGSGRTGTHFGIAVGNYVELNAGGNAAVNGIIIGTVGFNKPTIFGINTSKVAQLSGGTLSTDNLHIYYTGDATSTTAGGGIILDGGISVAKTVFAATLKLTNTLGLAYGGTNLDMTATGGANMVLKQTSAGGAITVAALVSGDIPNNAADTTGKSAKTDALNSATTVVNVSSATAPVANQVLTATDSTHATWQTPSGASGANPTASVGLTAVNGSASTFLRSDGAPALSQSIAPTWTGLHTFNREIDLAAITTPSTPASGSVLYTKTFANRAMLTDLDADGIETPLQGSLGHKQVFWVRPSTGTSLSNIGMTATISGTLSHPASTSTNLLTSTNHALFTSLTSANANGGWTSQATSQVYFWRGNASGLGGFYCVFRFGQEVSTNGARAFIGLATTTGVIAGSNLAANAHNLIGMGYDDTDVPGNWFIMRSDNTVGPTRVDLGSGAARNTTDMYELVLYCKPNDSQIWVRVTNLSTATIVLADTNYSTAIPTTTNFLVPQCALGCAATAVAQKLDFVLFYGEVR